MENFNDSGENREISATNDAPKNTEPSDEAKEQDSQELNQPDNTQENNPEPKKEDNDSEDDKPLDETGSKESVPEKTETENPETPKAEDTAQNNEESPDDQPLQDPKDEGSEPSNNDRPLEEESPQDDQPLDDKLEDNESPKDNETPEDNESPKDNETPEDNESPKDNETPEDTTPEDRNPEDEHPEGENAEDESPENSENPEGRNPTNENDLDEQPLDEEPLEEPREDSEAEQPEADDGTDWDRTSLTPEQEAQLKEMDDAGELDIPQENPDWQEPERNPAHLPTEKTGNFDGERGNSAFHPNDEAALAKMNNYGRDTVDYKDGTPDFSPFTQHDTPYGKMDGQVEIPHMTTNRENPTWEYGRRPDGTSHDPNYDLGNFAQADNALSEKMGNMTPEEVADYRKNNNLTWHECPDGKTMQLVPSEIHDACRHSGGVSEQGYRQAMGDVTAPVDGGGPPPLKDVTDRPEQLNGVREITRPYYNDAQTLAENSPEKGRFFTDHGEDHVEMTADKALEAGDAIADAIGKGNFQGENSDTRVAFSPDIDKSTLAGAALSHDTGMAGNGYSLGEKQPDGSYAVRPINKDDFDDVRKNHSLNSAINLLENRDAYHDLGYSNPQIDKMAAECMAHSKSSSGVKDLNSKEDWSTCFNKMDSAVNAYNQDHPDKPITFNRGNFENNDSQLGSLASETYALRIGDVSRDSQPDAPAQSSEAVHVDRSTIDNKAGSMEGEVGKADITIGDHGDAIPEDNIKSRQVHTGEQNIVGNRTFADDNGDLVHEVTVHDGASAPMCTQEALIDHAGELATAKDGNSLLDVKFDSPYDPEVAKSYDTFRVHMATQPDYKNVDIRYPWDRS